MRKKRAADLHIRKTTTWEEEKTASFVDMREREREKRDTRAELADERDSNSDSSWDGSRRCFTREIQPLLAASETDLRYSRGREDDGEP